MQEKLEKEDSHSYYCYCFDIHSSQCAEDRCYVKKKDEAKNVSHIFLHTKINRQPVKKAYFNIRILELTWQS